MKKKTRDTGIKSWAEEDRPREKLLLKGKAALSEAELIAILLVSGTPSISAVELAKQILKANKNNLHELARLGIKDLMKFRGIGEAKAISIIAALELGRRRKEQEITKKPKISSAADVHRLMTPHLQDLSHEEFWVVLLNRGNIVIKKQRISSGGVSGTVVDAKIIFKTALEELATSIILVHNHPSGNLKPSHHDLTMTKKLREAGKYLDTHIIDHVIYTNNNYYSFADNSML